MKDGIYSSTIGLFHWFVFAFGRLILKDGIVPTGALAHLQEVCMISIGYSTICALGKCIGDEFLFDMFQVIFASSTREIVSLGIPSLVLIEWKYRDEIVANRAWICLSSGVLGAIVGVSLPTANFLAVVVVDAFIAFFAMAAGRFARIRERRVFKTIVFAVGFICSRSFGETIISSTVFGLLVSVVSTYCLEIRFVPFNLETVVFILATELTHAHCLYGFIFVAFLLRMVELDSKKVFARENCQDPKTNPTFPKPKAAAAVASIEPKREPMFPIKPKTSNVNLVQPVA